MDIFKGIEHVSAEGASNRQYFEVGKYTIVIDKVFVHEKRLGGRLFVVETTVKDSDNPNIRPGEARNWVQSLGNEFALPRIKSFAGAAIGLCPKRQQNEINSQITKEVCEQMVSEKNPLKGKQLRLSCLKKTTKAGKDFNLHIWEVFNG